MQKIALLTTLLLLCNMAVLWSQINDGSIPKSFEPTFFISPHVPLFSMPQLDMNAIQKENEERDARGILMFNTRIIPTAIKTNGDGIWDTYPNGDKIWRARVQSIGAKAIALYFSDFQIPDGAKLYVYNLDKTKILGGFTSANNHNSGKFALGPIGSDDVIVEYFEPARVAGQGHFTLDGIGHMYRMIKTTDNFGDSDPCQVNVNCSPEGNNKTQQRDAVARILVRVGVNAGWCSGAMVNNVLQNCNRYFLTALHCALGTQGNNASIASTSNFNQWIFYFNFQSSGCTSPSSQGTLGNQSLTGAAMKAHSNDGGGVNGSDFLLLELNSTIPSSYNIFYAGWDLSNAGSGSGYSIHHPSGDIKKISTYTSSLTTTSWNGSGLPSHWRVFWSSTTNGHGVTEGGSSGSPIFNNSGRIVGTLTGGGSYCTATGNPDAYGKMTYHWTANGNAANRQLRAWLDPNNTGVTSLTGVYHPCTPTNALDAGISAINNPADSTTICDDPFAAEVVLENFGTTTLTTATINYQINTGTINTFSWTGSLASGATTTVTLPLINIPPGGAQFTFRAYTSNPNNGTDANSTNDETSVLSQYRPSSPLPYAEAFGGSSIPADIAILDQNNDNNTWAHSTSENGYGAASNTGAMQMDNFSSNFTGQFDWFFVPTLNLTGQTGTVLTFDVAYARYDATLNDTLIVAVNSDCGTLYTPLYWQGGSDLATAPDHGQGAGAFTPTAGEWRTDTIDLSNYDGASHVRIAFINKSGYGQNVFIDNINVQAAVSCNLAGSIASSNDVSCNGSNDGSVTINSTGGTPNYSYDIGSGPQNSGVFNNLTSGNYTITVTDNGSCTTTVGVSIGQPAALATTITSTTNVYCNGGNTGFIGMNTTGGTPSYTYNWGNGTQSANTFSGLMANTYVVTITDNNNCSTTVAATITEPSALTAAPSNLINPACSGANTGSIAMGVTGGTIPYSYNFGSGGQTSNTANNLSAGNYTVTITDANNCSTTAFPINLTEPTALQGSITDNGNGTADASASGGVPNYSYQWSANTNNQTTPTATGLVHNTTYTVTITDNNGCTTVANVTVNITNIDNIPNLAKFEIFPNPTQGIFQIQVDLKSAKAINLRVTNVLGQIFRSYNSTGKSLSIPVNIEEQANGVYFITLTTDKQTITRKITLNR